MIFLARELWASVSWFLNSEADNSVAEWRCNDRVPLHVTDKVRVGEQRARLRGDSWSPHRFTVFYNFTQKTRRLLVGCSGLRVLWR
ncbi:hypothetical protein BDW71DRAFT_192038 [Aspergillus fruticulosus]